MIANYNGEVKNKREQRSTNRNKEITRNRFNNFPQRQYSDEEFARIEQMLLQKSYLGKTEKQEVIVGGIVIANTK